MSNVIMCSECKKCDGDRCNYFDNDSDRESTIACILFEPKNPTLFDRITASPEVLAEAIVYEECEHSILDTNGCGATFPGGYTSAILDFSYGTKAEAIAATVEKLKEVYNG